MEFQEFVQVNPSAVSVQHAKLSDAHMLASSSMDADALRAVLKALGSWPESLEKAIQAIPVYLSKARMNELQELCQSIHIAVCDVIDRWWDDKDAKFWERMPIDPKAEAVLRWVKTQKSGNGTYRQSSGLWRPDYLISENAGNEKNGLSNKHDHFGSFKICEINCRYPLSGYILASTIDNFHRRRMPANSIFETTAPNVDSMIKERFGGYRTTWFLLGEGIPHVELVNVQTYFTNHRIGEVRFVRPEHLEVVSDDKSPSKSKLIATASSSDFAHAKETHTSMEIDIIVIGARQAQLLALPEKVLQELALRSLNDLRSIFLAHDKRMLAIVSQEVDNLTSKRGVISIAQSECLRQGLAETYIAKSKDMRSRLDDLYSGKSSKDDWVLKPIASGKGKGIVFGTEVATEADFHDLVRSIEETGAYVLQRVITQPRFAMISPGGNVPAVNQTSSSSLASGALRYLVGTFMMSDGQFLGTFWRASPRPICAFMQGAWFVGAVTEKDLQKTEVVM